MVPGTDLVSGAGLSLVKAGPADAKKERMGWAAADTVRAASAWRTKSAERGPLGTRSVCRTQRDKHGPPVADGLFADT